jgi:cytidine deaminase
MMEGTMNRFEHPSGGMSAEAAIFREAQHPVPLYDIEHVSVLGGFDFDRLQLGDMVLNLFINTAEFRNRAQSYRGFGVGAGAWAVAAGQRFGRVLGYNIKIDETDAVNIHGEDLVVAKAEECGYDEISVLAVVAPTQEDHASGVCAPTLGPCGRCRPMLAKHRLITERTLLATATPDFKAIELTTLEGLQRRHDHDDSSDITTFLFDETPPVFGPLPKPNSRGNLVLKDLEDVDETGWWDVNMALAGRYARRVMGIGGA